MASKAAALFVGPEPVSNGRDEVADAGISDAVAIEDAAFVEAAVRQDIGQEIGLSDIGQAGLVSAHPLHGFIDEVQATVIKGWAYSEHHTRSYKAWSCCLIGRNPRLPSGSTFSSSSTESICSHRSIFLFSVDAG